MKEFLTVKSGATLMRFEYDDILCIESDGNYCDIFFANGEPPTKIVMQLGKVVEALKKQNAATFIRVGKSLIVNRNYVTAVEPTKGKKQGKDNGTVTLSYGGGITYEYDVFKYEKYYEKDGKLNKEKSIYPGYVVREKRGRITKEVTASTDALTDLREALFNQ